jgi:putative ABC transport system substrate-binding protein
MPATRSILRSPSALVNRRDFIKVAAGSALAWPLHAYAQQKMLRIGVLWPGALPPAPPRMESFRQTLNLLGFVEDRNVVVELRYAKGGLHQLPALAAELGSGLITSS